MGKLKIGSKCIGTNECIVFQDSHIELVRQKLALPVRIDIGYRGTERRQIQLRTTVLRLLKINYPTVSSKTSITYTHIKEFPTKIGNMSLDIPNDICVICKCEGKYLKLNGYVFKQIFSQWEE